jgi:hypothetical protein
MSATTSAAPGLGWPTDDPSGRTAPGLGWPADQHHPNPTDPNAEEHA